MRKAETILSIISSRGQYGLPVKNAYRLLYQRDLYLQAYGKLYRNQGAMTEGITVETVDGMSLEKIDKIIMQLRHERYRWTPVRRTYIPKKNGKLRALSLPTWSDKLLQEVIRMLLEAYYEPQFSDLSHGFRSNRGCHTALKAIKQKGAGTKWFIEGDLCACFDRIDHGILLKILTQGFQDNRFIRLMDALLTAGYLENWQYNKTYSGVPAGSIIGPILSNVMLDQLDRYIEKQLIPVYTYGQQRKEYALYRRLIGEIKKAKRKRNWSSVKQLRKQLQTTPSYDQQDQNFRRLWYVRYADDFLLGLSGPKTEAITIRKHIESFLSNDLKLELSADKTLLTHAREERAKFLGYEIHVAQNDSKHDRHGRRCINGRIGFLVPQCVIEKKCKQYMQHGKPIHLPQRVHSGDYEIISQYQAEYRGIVQYYRMAYNLRTLNKLRHVMIVSLLKTLANKYKSTCTKIAKRYRATIKTKDGEYQVIQTKVERESPKKPLVTYFGGISLKWDKNAKIREETVGQKANSRNGVVKRLLAQQCELCGSQEKIEVHHIRKLADLKQKGRATPQRWQKQMSASRRKTLVVCRQCHNNIHQGKYDGKKLTA